MLLVASCLGLLLAGGLVAFLARPEPIYGSRLVRYSHSGGGVANRFVDLREGNAQLSLGSPDGRRVVVQWRDVDGHGWTRPETVFTDSGLPGPGSTHSGSTHSQWRMLDSRIRQAGGTVAILASFTGADNEDEDRSEVDVEIVCRDRACVVGDVIHPLAARDPQLSADGTFGYFGTAFLDADLERLDEPVAVLWRASSGFEISPWHGHPGQATDRLVVSDALLAPDGSFRLVTGRPVRARCAFDLLVSDAGSTDLRPAAKTLRRDHSVEHFCIPTLQNGSAQSVQVDGDDAGTPTFQFVVAPDGWHAEDLGSSQ